MTGAPSELPIPVDWYLYLSAALFIVGAAGVLTRRNLFIILFSIELMMNAVNINLVGFSGFHQDLTGQNFVLFTMAVAAAEAAVGLAIATALFRNRQTLMVDLFDTMKG
jgi:NADH-quinone oxidoreductase subunit K